MANYRGYSYTLADLNLDQIIAAHYPEFEGGVHPACRAVPNMTEAEFERLVNDIGSTGLRHEILRTKDHQLLDGKMRLLACYVVCQDIRVHTDPGYVDPWQVVHGLNIARTHLTDDQIADFEAVAAKAVQS